ncbi:hypothetical protein [Burkholderia multivorans]|uniref:hypothetical protein n=1 Tax=Burkholderia multivorans TaxID=87883 RepID=UPI001EFA26DA|nr:hypothetical protein [Burkholderia multivorans]
MQTVRNAHVEQRDAARLGWSPGSTGRIGMNGRNGMVVETSALLCMIGSSSGQRRFAVGRDRAGRCTGGLGFRRLRVESACRTRRETVTPVSTTTLRLLREARCVVLIDTQYGCCASSRKSAAIEVAVGEMEVL